MKEEILWQSKPSQLLYILRYFIFSIMIIFPIFIPVKILLYHLVLKVFAYHVFGCISVFFILVSSVNFLRLFCTKYQLTDERLLIYSGILNRTREEIELYRIKDYQVISPLHLRVFALSNIRISTSDRTTPVVSLLGLYNAYSVTDKLREKVEELRKLKRVHEID